MKQPLNPKVVVIALACVGVVVVGVALSMLGAGGSGGGPAVKPRKFTPPAGYQAPHPGAPMGAPNSATSSK